ncbi:hypothetical protein ABPG72_006521 [Tetrahymena utriculariae]
MDHHHIPQEYCQSFNASRRKYEVSQNLIRLIQFQNRDICYIPELAVKGVGIKTNEISGIINQTLQQRIRSENIYKSLEEIISRANQNIFELFKKFQNIQSSSHLRLKNCLIKMQNNS